MLSKTQKWKTSHFYLLLAAGVFTSRLFLDLSSTSASLFIFIDKPDATLLKDFEIPRIWMWQSTKNEYKHRQIDIVPFLPSFLLCLFSSLGGVVKTWNNSSVEVFVTLKGPEMLQLVGDGDGWLFCIHAEYSEIVVWMVSNQTRESSSLSKRRRSVKEGVSTLNRWPCFFDLAQYQSTWASVRTILKIQVVKG